MPSPPVEEGSSTSQTTQDGPVMAQNAPRSILSLWGNGAGPSQPRLPPQPAVPKRKRKKADEGPAQGRISLGNGNGAAWGIKKVEEEAPVVTARGRGKAKAGAELEELKEMSMKGRQRKSLDNDDGPRPTHNTGDSSLIGGSSPAPDPGGSQRSNTLSLAPQQSPQKRKRGRPRKSDKAIAALPPTSPDVIPILSSDPVVPLSPGGVTFAGSSGSLKASKVALSRTASVTSKGAMDDPIDVEHEPMRGPKKIAFAADKKAAHPLFARPATDTISEPDLNMSATIPPTTYDLSVKPSGANPKAATVKAHAFFGQRPNGVPGQMKNGWGGGVREGEEQEALWPGGDFRNHEPVAGPSRIPLAIKRRDAPPAPDRHSASSDTSDWLPQSRQHEAVSGHDASMPNQAVNESVVPHIASHPALLSVKSRGGSQNRETWAERYRPTQSAQVLGNELEATYLRDWMKTLSVGGTGIAPRKIVRKVKRAKPQLVEGWIVDDAGLFGDPMDIEEEEEVEYVEFVEPDLPLGQRPDHYPPLETSQLTNSILLNGPHGSGKSAAVHAAATELGWEVFEVYPGLGKRTAANLMSWVGDVGKNHLVVKGGKAEPPKEETKTKTQLKSFFGSSVRKAAQEDEDPIALTGSQGSLGEPIEVDTSPKKEEHLVLDQAESRKAVRQSLIFIDEADLLFAEENTFWPAVISLVAESRRPVILACNDPNRIPRDSLPLQTILHFRPPPSHLAIPYLETIALHENIWTAELGARLSRGATSLPPPLIEQPLPPNGNEPLPSFDLRRALMQMQMDRGRFEAVSPLPDKQQDLTEAFTAIDNASWADAYVHPRPSALMETSEIDRVAPTTDDELSIRALFKPDVCNSHPTTLPAYDYSRRMAEEIISLARAPLEPPGDLQTARTLYARSLLPILDPLIPLSAPLLPTPTLFTLYMPVLQDMVEWDDVLEVQESEALARGEGLVNRKTGRPKRATVGGGLGYGRYLDQEAIALQGARDSRLVWKS